MKKFFHNHIWPWSKIHRLELEIVQLNLRHEQIHNELNSTIKTRDGHIRKMATIIAIKGGILG